MADFSSVRRVAPAEFAALDPAMQRLFHLFDSLGITHDTYVHPPIFTVEEGLALNLPGAIAGLHGKTLLLTAADGSLCMAVIPETRRADLKAVARIVGAKRLSFASPDTMFSALGVRPGSATPFALINDAARRVRVLVDKDFADATRCVFHPLCNTHSTAIASSDLFVLLRYWGYAPDVLGLA